MTRQDSKIVQIAVATDSSSNGEIFSDTSYLFALLDNGLLLRLENPDSRHQPNRWTIVDPPVLNENVDFGYDGQYEKLKEWGLTNDLNDSGE